MMEMKTNAHFENNKKSLKIKKGKKLSNINLN